MRYRCDTCTVEYATQSESVSCRILHYLSECVKRGISYSYKVLEFKAVESTTREIAKRSIRVYNERKES